MIIYDRHNEILTETIVLKDAVHEEELMKSDFVRLAWSDTQGYALPAGAYVQHNGANYYLYYPYEPQQKNEAEYRYEPEFQHPKMYLAHVLYTHATKDTEKNDIELIEWSYTGALDTLLADICEAMTVSLREAGLIGEEESFTAVITDASKVKPTISLTFGSVDILSALTQIANDNECEWHIDWSSKTLYYGLISLGEAAELTVDGNVTFATERDAKEGYHNAYLVQGGTKNLARKMAEGEYISASVRLPLNKDKYPDGVIYTDSKGNIITKEDFDASGERKIPKPLIFDDVYPNLDLYVYDVRQRTRIRYEDEETKSKAIAGYDEDGNPIYERYADWYIRLAYPVYNPDGSVSEWRDFGGLTVRTPKLRLTYNDGVIKTILPFTGSGDDYLTSGGSDWYSVTISHNGKEALAYLDTSASKSEPILYIDEDSENYDFVKDAIASGIDSVLAVSGIDVDMWNKNAQALNALDEYTYKESRIISGKVLSCRFVPNADSDLPSALAGRDFELRYYDTAHTVSAGGDDEDTGVEIMAGDYLIIRDDGDPIIPTTAENRLIPYGDTTPSLRSNIVNLYNIVMSDDYITSAQDELEREAVKAIEYYHADQNSYNFRSIPTAFDNDNPNLYIGRKVTYTDLSGYVLSTRVIRLVTNIDFGCIQDITIGNKLIKGTQQQLKEDVKVIMAGGMGTTGANITITTGVATTTPSGSTSSPTGIYLSKIIEDKAKELITFEKGIKTGKHGVDGSGNAKLNTVKTTSVILGDYSADSISAADEIHGSRQFCLRYDEENDAIYVVKADGSPLNFYATGGISALGLNASGDSAESGSRHNIVVSGTGNVIADVVESTDGKTLTFYRGTIEGGTGGVTEDWVLAQGFALDADLQEHRDNSIRHITANERTTWNDAATKITDFLSGTDTDTIINKWSELETVLSGLAESDNLATILSGKADKDDVPTNTELYNGYVRWMGVSGNYLQVLKGDDTTNLLIPFATKTNQIVRSGEVSDLDNTDYWSDDYVISLASYGVEAVNKPETADNANSLVNICAGKHGAAGYYGWQLALQNNDNIWVRRWRADSTTQYRLDWYKLWHSGNVDPLDKTKGGSIANDLAIRGILEVGETTYLNELQMGDEIYLNNNWLNFDGAGSAYMGMSGEDIYITCDGIVDVNTTLSATALKASKISIGAFVLSVEDGALKISRTDGAAANVLTTGGLTALA